MVQVGEPADAVPVGGLVGGGLGGAGEGELAGLAAVRAQPEGEAAALGHLLDGDGGGRRRPEEGDGGGAAGDEAAQVEPLGGDSIEFFGASLGMSSGTSFGMKFGMRVQSKKLHFRTLEAFLIQ